ncbi:MAG: hypothetical protein II077_11710, partial [Treponema sp.]|nr:hypothetical protein [Treponema sp.]
TLLQRYMRKNCFNDCFLFSLREAFVFFFALFGYFSVKRNHVLPNEGLQKGIRRHGGARASGLR